MNDSSATHKQLAKNTLFLYGRKVVNLGIALYTSRLLLEALGVDDFGLYGLIGSIVLLFNSIRGLFSSSIQRFINIAKGKGENEQINHIFSMGIKIHLLLSVIFIIAVEIGGLIMIPRLDLGVDKISTAQWILQFSILATVATIMTVPYDAIIIANEKFNAYALISIIDSLMRLGVIFLLFIDHSNRVVLYAFLIFIVSVITRLINYYYCKKTFGSDVRFHNYKDKTLFKEMSSFAGWQFLGNSGFAIENSGLNFILNIFGGTVANAARTVAYQVMHAVSQFVSDINVSFNPRIMMEYSAGNNKQFTNLLFLSSKVSFLICVMLSFPIFQFAPSLLKYWLGNVPEHSLIFVRLIMCYMIVRSFHGPVDTFFKSIGKLKKYQIGEFIVLSSSLIFAWLGMKLFDLSLSFVFIVMIIIEVIDLMISITIGKIYFDFPIKKYFKEIMVRSAIALTILGVLMYVILTYTENDYNLIETIIGCLLSLICGGIIASLITLSRKEINSIIKIFKLKVVVKYK